MLVDDLAAVVLSPLAVLEAWDAGHWTAAAAWATAVVAAAAAIIGLWQLREARRLRIEQAQPYVVAYMEGTRASPMIIDLVVRNFGATAAYDVAPEASPALKRSDPSGGVGDVWIFETLPVLAPGQEWRTVWDHAPDRQQTSLPDRHEVTLRYNDWRGMPVRPSHAVLDWGAFKGRQWVQTYNMHHAAKALREIDKTIKKWREGAGRGLAVYVRDGDARDAQRAERRSRAADPKPDDPEQDSA